jgi:DNA processing protein
MKTDQLLYQIGISLIPMVGPKTARSLISYCGGVKEVFEAGRKELLRIPGIGEKTAQSILSQNVLLTAEREIAFMEEHGIQPLFYLDKSFPTRLKNLPDSPLLLFYKGNAELNARRVVAIVGTRRPTSLGRRLCEELVEGLQPFDVAVISGLAFGIDITAHRKCVELGIPTLGALGHGLASIYPPQHRSTALQMIENGGLLSEYISLTPPDREHFPMRNRIIAGMCDALVVVETARRGGSMISAYLAGDYNRDVFAIPGRPRDEQSKGCNHLIKTHKAALIENAADLAYAMNWELPGERPKVVQPSLFVELSDAEQAVADFLKPREEAGIDELTYALEMNSSQMAALLLNLEFKGVIRSLPGKRYVWL